MMATILEFRRGPDRRRQPRGGRRRGDRDGLAPLVLIVDEDPAAVERSEAVLAKLRFAVTTTSSIDEAVRIIEGVHPDLVVASGGDALRIKLDAPSQMPLVVMSPGLQESPHAFVEEIRRALGAARIHS